MNENTVTITDVRTQITIFGKKYNYYGTFFKKILLRLPFCEEITQSLNFTFEVLDEDEEYYKRQEDGWQALV